MSDAQQSAGVQLPLAMVREGSVVTVVRVRGTDEMRRHLENLGFVVSQGSSAGTIASVKGAQVGIDHATAMHVFTN